MPSAFEYRQVEEVRDAAPFAITGRATADYAFRTRHACIACAIAMHAIATAT